MTSDTYGAFLPTGEQQAALDLFGRGDSMKIEAGAGTGKTATLQILAESTPRRGQYLAFNKAIVVEAQAKMPDSCAASTAHSLAYQAVGKNYRGRLNGARMRSHDIARMLGIDSYTVKYGSQSKTLAAGFLAGILMKAVGNFCTTADEAPDRRHVPYIDGIDVPRADGRRTYDHNDRIRDELAPMLEGVWADLTRVDGQLPFNHGVYLKLWQLSHPTIPADYILFDEAQDANPVMAAVVAEQDHAQLVYVGDENQAIYEFTGAVNALAAIASDHRQFLTQSFRFGPAIADVANLILGKLDTELRLSGTPTISSMVGPLAGPAAILCRTNARAVTTVLRALQDGRSPHLVGGGKEIAAFARAASELQSGRSTGHPELACFSSWGEVQEYVENDPQGGELRLLVGLVDDFGVPTILKALDGVVKESDADLIVSTAHKAKGREWDSVQISNDFPPSTTDQDLRLLYVAATRARVQLDDSAVRYLYSDVPKPTAAAELLGIARAEASIA